ncbi:hypothetical protein K3172_12925 [Qipengyuania sp. 6B39]|uniref:phage tail tube protein n=1 Tax=Qipengyuania proteolytica TaxID=2867239 RepID=UPI001C89AD5B|nr:phage tail tube protein [Qipengyuania proteolytica]MBX7496762.1 hypothetical protein [Qipengyuania proteolytica]
MAEDTEASTGYAGEVWLSSDDTVANLYELVEVVSFSLPSDTSERVETTHLKSPNRRRQYTSGMIDGGEIEVTLNFRPGTDTDLAIEDALSGGDARAVRFNIPETGVLAWTYDTLVVVTGYDKGEVTADGKMEATVTMAVSGAVTGAAYTPPV